MKAGQLFIIFPTYISIILFTLGEKHGICCKAERAWVNPVNEEMDGMPNSQGNTFNAFLNCGSMVVPMCMRYLHS